MKDIKKPLDGKSDAGWCAALAGIAFLVAPFVSSAKTCVWNSTTSSHGWNDTTHWVDGNVPADGDDVVINHSCFFDMPNGVRLRSLTFVKPDSGGIAINCGYNYKLGFLGEDGVTNICYKLDGSPAFNVNLNVQIELSGAVVVDVPANATVSFPQTVSDGETSGSITSIGGGTLEFKVDNTFTGGVTNNSCGKLATFAGSGFGTGKVVFGPVSWTNNTYYGMIDFKNTAPIVVPNVFELQGSRGRFQDGAENRNYLSPAVCVGTGDVTFDSNIVIHGNRCDRDSATGLYSAFRMIPTSSSQAAATYTFNGDFYNADDYNPKIELISGAGSSIICNGKVASNAGRAGASGSFTASAGGTVEFNKAGGSPGNVQVNNYTLDLNEANMFGTYNCAFVFNGNDATKCIVDLGGYEQKIWHVKGAGIVRGEAGSLLEVRHSGEMSSGVGAVKFSLNDGASVKFASTDIGSCHTNDWTGGTCTSTGVVELARQQEVNDKSPLLDSRLNLRGAMSLPNISEIRVGPSCWLDVGSDVEINHKVALTLTDDGDQKAKIVIPANKTVCVDSITLNGVTLGAATYTSASLPNNIVGDGSLVVVSKRTVILFR